MAPEVLLYNKYAGKMADIWSCGILLYCMLTSCFPFRRKEDEGLETQAVLQKMLPRILKADFQKPQASCTPTSHVLENTYRYQYCHHRCYTCHDDKVQFCC